MIIDKLENAELYENIHPGFKLVVEWMRNVADPDMAEGRYDIEGGTGLCYAYKWDKASRKYDETDLEAHTKVIDFHLVLEGEEYFGVAPIEDGDEGLDYVPEHDIIHYKDHGSNCIHLKQGDMYLVWPHEGHKSYCHFDKPYMVKKIVGKLVLKP